MLQGRLGAKRFELIITMTNLWGACAACVDDAMETCADDAMSTCAGDAMIASFVAKS
jgi:hypothetical protein